ncbi:MAG: hypothetical protein ACI4U9_00575 [Clostridia bacterium]
MGGLKRTKGANMLILAISTSSKICSVALLEDDKPIKELNIDNLRTHSENLVPLIDELFKTTNKNVSELDLIACDVGPRFFYRNTYWNCHSKGNCRSNPNTSNIVHFFRGFKLQYKFKHNMLFDRC